MRGSWSTIVASALEHTILIMKRWTTAEPIAMSRNGARESCLTRTEMSSIRVCGRMTNLSPLYSMENRWIHSPSLSVFQITHSIQSSASPFRVGCFEAVRDFSVDGLIALESIVIGKDCFAFTKNWSEVRESNRTDGSCRIVNCPHLKSIQIGDYSFSDYHTLIIDTLPSLQSIDIGEMCFYRTACFSLTSVITNLVCPSRFAQTRICHTERWCIVVLSFCCAWEWCREWDDDSDLPTLQSIRLGSFALEGDYDDSQKTIQEEPFNYKNTLIMRSCW